MEFLSGSVEALSNDDLESIIPLANQVLIIPDKPKEVTRGGIVLPDRVRIPTCRGRVLAVSYFIVNAYNQADVPAMHRVDIGDRVVFHFNGAMPNNFESENPPVLVPIGNILGKVKKNAASRRQDSSRD